jgi:hypothetical protein
VNRLYREFLRVHLEIKSMKKKKKIVNAWTMSMITTSFVEHVFGQNFSRPLIIGSANEDSFSINCTIQ